MKHLIIKHIGPVEHVDIELKPYNFIIGPQSSGKSTIAKIYSTCQWIEKEVATTQNSDIIGDGNSFIQLVESYHKMKGYFYNDSKILYETDSITLLYEDEKLSITLKSGYNYRREKICYIPAERNAVTLPELQGLAMGNTSVRSYIFDWFNARDSYGEDNKSGILNLDIKYFYDDSQKEDKDRIVHQNGATYNIPLSNASSGLQSVVPLTIMLHYYTNEYFDTFQSKTSFDESDKEREIRRRVVDNVVLRELFPKFDTHDRPSIIKEVNERIHKQDPEVMPYFEKYIQVTRQLLVPARTSFIIEEPEQNIYPMTQLDLIDNIVSLCVCKRKHLFMITTHSPFIISYINILLQGKINPDDLNVWTIMNGKLENIMGYDKASKTYIVDGYELSAPMMTVFNMYREGKKSNISE